MKKRLTAWAVTAAMCLCQLIPSRLTAYADDYDPVTVTSKIVGSAATDLKAGEKFYVDVSLSGLSGCSFALNASWDTDDLELTDAVPGTDFYSGSSAPFTYVPFDKSSGRTVPEQALKDFQNKRTSDICVFAFASGENLDCSGVAVTLEFTVKQGAENGNSEINVYFDPKNPPEYFGANYENIVIETSEGYDDEHNGRVSAEINDTSAPSGTQADIPEEGSAADTPEGGTAKDTPTETRSEPTVPDVTKSFGSDPVIGDVTDDNSPFVTIIVETPEEDAANVSTDMTNISSPSFVGNEDNDIYNGRADDVSAAAGASDKASENIKRIAISCTAVLAAGLIVLMSQKQKRKNNGSDRIK